MESRLPHVQLPPPRPPSLLPPPPPPPLHVAQSRFRAAKLPPLRDAPARPPTPPPAPLYPKGTSGSLGLPGAAPPPLPLPPRFSVAAPAIPLPPPPIALGRHYRRCGAFKSDGKLVTPAVAEYLRQMEGAAYVMLALMNLSHQRMSDVQLRPVAVGAFSLEEAVPHRSANRGACEDTFVCAMSVLPIDAWNVVLDYCTTPCLRRLAASCRFLRQAVLNDVMAELLLYRRDPATLDQLRAVGFTRYADVLAHYTFNSIALRQVDDDAGPHSSSFVAALPSSACRYVFLDPRCVGLRFNPSGNPRPSGSSISAEEDGKMNPLTASEEALRVRGCSILWTPATVSTRDRTVYALCYQEVKQGLPTIRGLEARDPSELTAEYIRNRIPKRFRPFFDRIPNA